MDFSGGIDSGRVTTVVSEQNPHGLPYSLLAWLTNGTVRGGGITQRLGYQQLVAQIPGAAGLFQGCFLYEPIGANPYLVLSIGGVIWKVLVEAPYTSTNLSAAFNLFNPSSVPKAFFAQGESFLVIQAGDYVTLPLFWDGTTLRRSNGLQPASPGFVSSYYPVTNSASFLIPPVSGTGVLSLTANYPGVTGDVISFGAGTFLVTHVGVNAVTLQTITSSWAGIGSLPPQLLKFTTTSLRTIHAVTLTADWTIADVGQSVTITLSAPYAGAVNDVATWAIQGTGIANASYQVTAVAGNTVTLLALSIAPGFVGGVWHATDSPFEFLAVPAATTLPLNEIPAAGPMVYYQGRLWYAIGRIFTAGDIVGGPSGTLAYNFKDSILMVTENPLAIGGDGFAVPDNSGNITAMDFVANNNVTLGQGPLYVFTRKQIYGCQVPISRTDWIAAGTGNVPLITVAQRRFGTVSDRCVVPVNGDLFYQTSEPAIRSLKISVRNDDSWLNTALSRNENRVLSFNDRSLMDFATGINFDNRLLQAILPFATPAGVAFRGVIPLDFDIISTFGQEQDGTPPAWEGMTQGLNHLQLTEGDFGGRQRAFSTCYGDDGNIQIWELTDFLTVDVLPSSGPEGNRVSWYFETPAYDFAKIFELKRLDGGELYIDLVSGTVDVLVEYRTDANNCWQYLASRPVLLGEG